MYVVLAYLSNTLPNAIISRLPTGKCHPTIVLGTICVVCTTWNMLSCRPKAIKYEKDLEDPKSCPRRPFPIKISVFETGLGYGFAALFGTAAYILSQNQDLGEELAAGVCCGLSAVTLKDAKKNRSKGSLHVGLFSLLWAGYYTTKIYEYRVGL
ncbi:hypothetical protein K493DRAFT_75674 [Basidiobolus meristosporus CBS 931.73]|uniref:Uncharacterized protein n=1 Tax=Basidiobolus meristosporus CBS 931.73 TaxID=1314790 RepID=A0A1Y1XSN7_9FUNG|nr:hypothetical protein K493DRAFT_75674 [Basidiobolus meristosporus CBS 931.73]|eukprot:ORX88743.1 hypothetical protein K493DRAFT_75674 [Basidiobolus meristosporus CBS 931.73]